MAQVNKVSASRATASAAKGGDWESLTITRAANGFTVHKAMPYIPTDPPPYLATEPGELLAYIETCVGKSEHLAHEASEEKGEKSEAKGY